MGTCPALHDIWASQVLQALPKPFLERHTIAEGSGLMWNRRRQGEERGRGQSHTPAREGRWRKSHSVTSVVAVGVVVSSVPVARVVTL